LSDLLSVADMKVYSVEDNN